MIFLTKLETFWRAQFQLPRHSSNAFSASADPPHLLIIGWLVRRLTPASSRLDQKILVEGLLLIGGYPNALGRVVLAGGSQPLGLVGPRPRFRRHPLNGRAFCFRRRHQAFRKSVNYVVQLYSFSIIGPDSSDAHTPSKRSLHPSGSGSVGGVWICQQGTAGARVRVRTGSRIFQRSVRPCAPHELQHSADEHKRACRCDYMMI